MFCLPLFVHAKDLFDHFFCILFAFYFVFGMDLSSHVPVLCYESQRVDRCNLPSIYC